MRKNIAFIFTFLLAITSLASAQNLYKLPTYNGVGGMNFIDTGSGGQTLTPNGANGPFWKTNSAVITLANDTLTTGQTLIGTPLQFNAVDTQATYEFEIYGFDTSSSIAGVKFGFAIPSGATIKARIFGEDSSATQSRWDVITASATASAAYFTKNATNGMFTIAGEVSIGSTAGNVIFEFLKNTSGTAGILKNSLLIWRRKY
jgi:hypothetical protein